MNQIIKDYILEHAIELSQVVKDYPGVRALSSISFGVKKGTIHGFLGPNGAGKSTTMNIITGTLKPTEGTISIDGDIGYLPELPPLYENMQVEDYIRFVGKINGVTGKKLSENLDRVIERCGLGGVRKRLIRNLSKGYKQRVGIAQALVYDAPIVVLDEPTVGLDPNSVVEIRDLIKSLEGERTVLLSTHILHEAHQLCSEITIIDQGHILESGAISELKKSFQANTILRSVVSVWSDDIREEILKEFACEEIKVEHDGDHICLLFYMSGDADQRSSLVEFLVSRKCGVLSFTTEELNLEDIFQMATNKEEER